MNLVRPRVGPIAYMFCVRAGECPCWVESPAGELSFTNRKRSGRTVLEYIAENADPAPGLGACEWPV